MESGSTPTTRATSFKAWEPVTLPLALLNDWMYVRQGHVYGGFTVDAEDQVAGL